MAAQQLDFFPASIQLECVEPATNKYRFYQLRVLPDLFGNASLQRNWGRIGSAGRQRIALFQHEGQAANAMNKIIKEKLRRGYQHVGT